jgi:hypothetical protein
MAVPPTMAALQGTVKRVGGCRDRATAPIKDIGCEKIRGCSHSGASFAQKHKESSKESHSSVMIRRMATVGGHPFRSIHGHTGLECCYVVTKHLEIGIGFPAWL